MTNIGAILNCSTGGKCLTYSVESMSVIVFLKLRLFFFSSPEVHMVGNCSKKASNTLVCRLFQLKIDAVVF